MDDSFSKAIETSNVRHGYVNILVVEKGLDAFVVPFS